MRLDFFHGTGIYKMRIIPRRDYQNITLAGPPRPEIFDLLCIRRNFLPPRVDLGQRR